MNRRMRKKRHLGEFREFGAILKMRVPDDIANNNAFWDGLFMAAESRNLGLGGTVNEMFVTRLCTRGACQSCDRRVGRGRMRGRLTGDEIAMFARDLLHGGLGVDYVWVGPMLDANHCTEAEYEAAIPVDDAHCHYFVALS